MKLTIDVARVKEAAATSPEARKLLETLFPEAFPNRFQPGDLVRYKGCSKVST